MTQEFRDRYIAARRSVIARRYDRMNAPQREAVLATEGPLLVLAGAGSGKTTVLIHRVDNLLTFGRGSDTDFVPEGATEEDLAFLESFSPSPESWARARGLCAVEPAAPWSVIAITFTNKAAGELKARLEKMCGPAARDIWAATFHSACVRILRRDVEKLGLGLNADFTIYDTDDSKRVVRDIVKDMGEDEKSFPPRNILSIISGAKDRDLSPEAFAAEAGSSYDWRMPKICRIYDAYVRRLLEANAVDFDDIVLHAVHLLEKNGDVLRYYQNRFRYVLVDEYQDTNYLQYRLSSLLAGERGNLCVVGDDDQSIYRFRGADVGNILRFETERPRCRTIRLEQNYRSTQRILDASNAVIGHNAGRKGKTLWTDRGAGEKVLVKTVYNESEEARFVADRILLHGTPWRECAVLYRTNAQSNALEMALKRAGVPYRVYGGMKFFDRAEVRDMLAYLAVVNNPADELRLRRIVNTPLRGIGSSTLDRVEAAARRGGTSMFAVMQSARDFPELKSAAGKLEQFAELISGLRAAEKAMELPDFYDLVCERTGYLPALEAKNDMESRGRAENVRELRSSVVGYLDDAPEDASLAGFLDSVSLYTDLDDAGKDGDCVSLMTIHSAKGLEFDEVYVAGMEEGVFPNGRAMEPEELEEERRLCYVAMTRARKRLTMTAARQRMLYGRTASNLPSRFLDELPEEAVERQGDQRDVPAAPAAPFPAPFAARRAPVRAAADRVSSAPPARGSAPAAIALKKGDRVRHRTFGAGLVLSVRPMGGDALMEVAFDDAGTKKLMYKVAIKYMERI